MDIETVYRNVPSFTKFYLATFIINTCLISLELVEFSDLELDYEKAILGLEVWRFFTCFAFYNGFSILFVIIIVLSHVCLSTIEHYFRRRMQDFIFMIIFVWCCHLTLGWLLDTHHDMMAEFMCSFMYIYCRREREDRVEIFGVAIKARIFPWAWIVLCKISGYRIIKIIAGYTIGHLYDYLKFIMPETLGYSLLETPRFLNWMVMKIEKRQPQQANEVDLVDHGDAGELAE
ncbi:unnamed protein product [Moneuplotes crassus]|uniref:Derlin n=1 Tax=Euplotes crassus TaxID=5936 RepID=A0AAD1XS58_EUPCR|nr:unnamed protein product [Moneuplotes crassus]